MTLRFLSRRAFTAVAVVLLLALGWTGLSGSVREVPSALTMGQYIQAVFQGVYGALALLVIVATARVPRFARIVQWSWAVSLALCAGLAPVVWGGTSPGIGVVTGVAALLVALAIVWLLRTGVAGASPAQDAVDSQRTGA